MACPPNTSCYGSGTVVYPRNCGINPCTAIKTGTDIVYYNGANLPCTGIDTCDNLTVSLQKIDEKLCPEAIANAFFTAITNNVSLYNIFCTFVNSCIPTTTTTSSTSTTTTTTTTAAPETMQFQSNGVDTITFSNLESFNLAYDIDWGDGNIDSYSAGFNSPTHTYSSTFTGNITVISMDLTDILEFNLVTIDPTTPDFPIVVLTSELAKLDGLLALYTGEGINISGIASELPDSLLSITALDTNMGGATTDFPSALQTLNLYGLNTISGDVGDFPTTLSTLNLLGNNTVSGNISGLPTGLADLSILGSNTVTGNVVGFPTGLINISIIGSNTISGDIIDLPATSQYCQILGSNTLTGNIGDLPSTLQTVLIGGVNTINGDIGDLSATITYCLIQGNNTISGDVVGIPTPGITNLYIEGDNTIFGDVSDLPTSLEALTVLGDNALTGDVVGLPSGLLFLDIEGNNTLSGSIADLPAGILKVILDGSNVVSGDINVDLPADVYFLSLSGLNTANVYTHAADRVWASPMQEVYIVPTSSFTSTEIDNMLIDLATYALSWTGLKIVTLKGTRTASSDAAVTTLTGLGVTVTLV